jgi:hypothetical protein
MTRSSNAAFGRRQQFFIRRGIEFFFSKGVAHLHRRSPGAGKEFLSRPPDS